MKKKMLIITVFSLLIVTVFGFFISADSKKERSGLKASEPYQIDTSTNFFTQKEDTRKVEIVDKGLEMQGYHKVTENSSLALYLTEEIPAKPTTELTDAVMGIALVDKLTGYTWYSEYEKTNALKDAGYLDEALTKVESGVTIEYYDANSTLISIVEKSLSTANTIVKYTKLQNGFKANVKFVDIGISFDVNVTIDKKDLIVEVPYDSLLEEKVKVKGKKGEYDYQLRSVTLFPYFGSQNYEINGYSFIPDGSGALIRYTDEVSSATFQKEVYGKDYGIVDKSVLNPHLKEGGSVSLPIYGVNHGYNQAAFLCQITSGDGAAELHSYPYMSAQLPFNTTFFKFITRDDYLIAMSDNSSLRLINDTVYPTNYSLKYSFLSHGDANYVGMANRYREDLNFDEVATNPTSEKDVPLHLEVLGVDYKQGLFGKNYVEMTTYEDALNIVKDLNYSGVNNVNLTYLGWNKGGYFNDGAVNAKLQSSLGNKGDFRKLTEYMNEHNMTMDVTINPLISDTYGFGNKTVKRLNLASFEVELNSSLKQVGYFVSPSQLSDAILKKAKNYDKLGIYGFNIDYLNQPFAYREDRNIVSRSEMIDVVCAELEELHSYNISTTSPAAYLYRYLTNYYSANYESSKYLYETDSVPFISILLSGYVNLFSPNINYISDYDLMSLRMVEYNMYPSFIVTENEAYELRFTNYEYLNSTQYELWNGKIKEVYGNVNPSLRMVNGATITNHRSIDTGVVEISYSNGRVIYVNYNNQAYSNGSIQVGPNSCYVKEVV